MAVVNTYSLSKLENTLRMDAEYYQPKYLEIERKMLETKSCKLWKHINGEFITGPFGSEFVVEGYVEDSPYRYVRGRDVKEFFLRDNENVYIPRKDFSRLGKYALQTGDILISVVGTLGDIAVVDENTLPAIFSCKSTVFRSTLLDPFYLIAYLNSKFGRSLLVRKVRGHVQTGLNINDLRSTPIFVPGKNVQERISETVRKAKESLDSSKSLYSKAEGLLLQELGLKDFKQRYELAYTANLSKAVRAHRADAEYFQPFYDVMEKHLVNSFAARPIGKIDYIDVTTGQYSKNYVEKTQGRPYIRGTDIETGTINTDDLVYIAPQDQIESKRAKEGDVVVTRVGTIGLSGRIPKDCEGGTVSDNLIRLRFDQKKLDQYYLALFLGSLVGVSLMMRNSRGSVQQRLNQETLKQIVVPILSPEKQLEIASLVQQSHKTRKKAKDLMEEAKREVEKAIENKYRKY